LGGAGLLVIPAAVFLGAFFIVPLGDIAVRSVTDPGLSNYSDMVGSSLYARVLWTTVRTGLIVTAVALLLGYPYAYVMHHSGRRTAAILAAMVLLPFWTSLLVRTYAWTVLLQDTGIVNDLLKTIGLIDEPIQLMRNSLGVTIGMTHILLPMMVLPIYAGMRRIDPNLTTAALSLGATPRMAFWRVFLPLSAPGVAAGCLLVFVVSLGFYITPAILGSPSNAMLSELVVVQVSELGRFGFGSALAMVLMLLTLLIIAVAGRWVRLGDALGFGTVRR
jgi:putative spermidine/putrescine transport system permease protein